MAALGLSDKEIGGLATISMAAQVFFALISGPLVDKYGRRLITFLGDLMAWGIPCLIFACSQNFIWFVAGTVLSGTVSVVNNAWTLLMIEDCDPKMLVSIYSLTSIAGLLSVFFAPISTLLIAHYALVPVMRGLYLFAFVMMTLKCALLYRFSTETQQGAQRKVETRHTSIFRSAVFLKDALQKIRHNPATPPVMAMFILFNIGSVVSGNFFSLFITRNLSIPDQYVALFPILRSLIMLVFFCGLQHILSRYRFQKPMLLGLGLYVAATLALIVPWAGGWARTIVYTVLEACAYSIVSPRKDSLVAIFVEKHERARITGLLYMAMLLVSAPFGWIAGVLATKNQGYPFLLNLGVFLLFFLLVAVTRKRVEVE